MVIKAIIMVMMTITMMLLLILLKMILIMWLWPVPRSRPGSLSQVEAKLSQRCSGNPSPWTFQDSSRFSCTNWKPKYSSGRWWGYPPLSTKSHCWVKLQEFLSQSVGHFYDSIGFLDIFTGWQRLPIKFRRAPEPVNISAAGCWVSAVFLVFRSKLYSSHSVSDLQRQFDLELQKNYKGVVNKICEIHPDLYEKR